MFSDTIADMLTRIRNASMAGKKEVDIPFSNQKKAIAKVLLKEGYIAEIVENKKKVEPKDKLLKIKLRYKQGMPAIEGIIKVSKPGRRVYKPYKKMPRVLSGFGMAIVSTSKGVMSAEEAKKKKQGGEIICKVW